MKERPILFSGEMVKAILDGRKTQTRRVMKPQPIIGEGGSMVDLGNGWAVLDGIMAGEWNCPYGKPGDRLWVRETWRAGGIYADIMKIADLNPAADEHIHYRADEQDSGVDVWRPSIHMPRWASRITLEVTDIRVERVQDISETDVGAEGIESTLTDPNTGNVVERCPGDRWAFAGLWDSINAKRGYSWESNPWVWVVEFKRVQP